MKNNIFKLISAFCLVSLLCCTNSFAVPDSEHIFGVDGKNHVIYVGGQYGDETYIIGKATTTDNINYYSVPFQCEWYVKYAGPNGINYTYHSNQMGNIEINGNIKASETKSFVTNRVLITNRQDPFVEFWNKSCSTLFDGDTCVNALKQGNGQPYVYINCNYVS